MNSSSNQINLANNASSSAYAKGEWKSAIDQKSSRVYYYNTKTKETTWTKPVELATPAEQKEMQRKKEETLQFFREMENNIKKRLQVSSKKNEVDFDSKIEYYSAIDEMDLSINRHRSVSIAPPRRVRTISSMDDEILGSSTNRNSMRIPLVSTGSRRNMITSTKDSPIYYADDKDTDFTRRNSRTYSNRFSGILKTGSHDEEYPLPVQIEAKDVTKDDFKVGYQLRSPKKPRTMQSSSIDPPIVTRRNSTGTIYVNTTMSKQDNEATIQCVCIVIRAHMLQAARENITPKPKYDVFKDSGFTPKSMDAKNQSEKGSSSPSVAEIPSLSAVKEFFLTIFSKSQLESDCIIMALIYCERLVKETKGKLCIRFDNWKSILFACLVMASKVWDDLSMWNVDFSHVYPAFDLHRINQLELAMLDALNYVIKVSAGEYAKYYFHLRSMMARLGIQDDANFIPPLDLAGARKLQLSTEKYQQSSIPRRTKSVSVGLDVMSLHRMRSMGDEYSSHNTVGLEQLIHEDHMDADGQHHVNKKSSLSASKSPTSYSSNTSSLVSQHVPHSILKAQSKDAK